MSATPISGTRQPKARGLIGMAQFVRELDDHQGHQHQRQALGIEEVRDGGEELLGLARGQIDAEHAQRPDQGDGEGRGKQARGRQRAREEALRIAQRHLEEEIVVERALHETAVFAALLGKQALPATFAVGQQQVMLREKADEGAQALLVAGDAAIGSQRIEELLAVAAAAPQAQHHVRGGIDLHEGVAQRIVDRPQRLAGDGRGGRIELQFGAQLRQRQRRSGRRLAVGARLHHSPVICRKVVSGRRSR
jgi:hypothetical protein